MAKTANINIRIDPETKTKAEKLFASFGITITDAINIFLRKSIMEGGLPFEVKQPKYNEETEAAMEETRAIMQGKDNEKSPGSDEKRIRLYTHRLLAVVGLNYNQRTDSCRFCNNPCTMRIFCARRHKQVAEHNKDNKNQAESGIGNRRFPAYDV